MKKDEMDFEKQQESYLKEFGTSEEENCGDWLALHYQGPNGHPDFDETLERFCYLRRRRINEEG